MFLIVGTKYRYSENGQTADARQCGRCGASVKFIKKTGRNYLTLFFLLPIFPVGKSRNILECPNCRAQYQTGDF